MRANERAASDRGAVDPFRGTAQIVCDRHRRLAGRRDAVDVGGLEPGIGHRVECGVGVQLDLRHVRDDAEPGGLGGADENGALVRPIRNNRTGRLDEALAPDAVYRLVRGYSAQLGFEIGAHLPEVTATTNARPSGRHRQGRGVARPREYRDHLHLRSPLDPARVQPHIQG
jgi:hypothetical protein